MLTTRQVIDRVKHALGAIKGLNMRIELNEDDIALIVQRSLDELVDKVDTPSMLVLPYSEVIDVSKYKIASVDHVMRSESPVGTAAGTSLDPFYLSSAVAVGGSQANGSMHGVLQMQASYAIRAQAQNTIQAELVYFHDLYKKVLLISYAGTRPSAVTILYRPEIQCVEDLPSMQWVNYLVRLAIAHGKCLIGRARGKYTVASSPATLNNDILAEGREELTAIYTELAPLSAARIL